MGVTAHVSVPPNILRSSVVGCARKYEQSKKGVFLVRKESYTTFRSNIVNIRKIWEKEGKIRKIWSMTKKKSSEIFAVKMDIFSEKDVIQKSWSAKNLSVPQTRRQVSATA